MTDKKRVLIVKTGYSEMFGTDSDSRVSSLGDVLRTTPILHLFEKDEVTWATDQTAFPLLEGNPYVHRLLHFDWITARQLAEETFDTVVNLERIPGICVAVEDIPAPRRYGFCSERDDRTGEIRTGIYKGSKKIEIGFDKSNNTRSLQEILFSMFGIEWKEEEYVLGYRPRPTGEFYDVALNTICGAKWPTKAWPTAHWDELERKLSGAGLSVTRQDRQDSKILGDLRSYMDWVNSANNVVSIDTLGLHIAIALRKKVLGLFGPTPPTEISFYGRGQALTIDPKLECMPCFAPNCTYAKERYCMTALDPERVYDETMRLASSRVVLPVVEGTKA